MLSTRVYVLITAGRCYLCVTLLGPCSLLPLAGEQQKLCLCEGEALASALSQALSECLFFFRMLRRPRVCILCGAAEFDCALGVWIVDKIIQCTDLADLEAFEAERRRDFFGVSRDEERAFVELQNQFALRFQQLVLESKAFSSTTERLERLERQFDGLLLAISSLKAQRMTDASTSTIGVQMVEAGTETSFEPIASFKSLSVSAPSAPRGAPFCQVNPISNELMRKTGMSLRRGQPRSPSVLHWLVHTYYQVCLTFLRQCPGVPFWHLGFFGGSSFFSGLYIYQRWRCRCSCPWR